VLGALIRQQRELAELPMRELARVVGISNPYLSQIERGLRAPSYAVLEAIAETPMSRPMSCIEWRVSSAGPSRPTRSPPTSSTELTAAQRLAMREIYRGFLDANIVRHARTE